MKKIILFYALFAFSNLTFGQRITAKKIYDDRIPRPHGNIRPTFSTPANVYYDGATSVLNVSAGSKAVTIEIAKSGGAALKTIVAANTTKQFILMDYGMGTYSIIVCQDKTVIFSKNIYLKNF